jgi:hypothetical protein
LCPRVREFRSTDLSYIGSADLIESKFIGIRQEIKWVEGIEKFSLVCVRAASCPLFRSQIKNLKMTATPEDVLQLSRPTDGTKYVGVTW